MPSQVTVTCQICGHSATHNTDEQAWDDIYHADQCAAADAEFYEADAASAAHVSFVEPVLLAA